MEQAGVVICGQLPVLHKSATLMKMRDFKTIIIDVVSSKVMI
jgi:hypothetical protein